MMTSIRKLAGLLSLVSFCSLSNAQTVDQLVPGETYSIGNLVNQAGWEGAVNVQQLCFASGEPGNCGPDPSYRPDSGNINFSYGYSTITQMQNIANAIPYTGTGLQVNGFNFGFTAKNGNGWDDGRVDTLYAFTYFKDSTGKIVENFNWDLNYKFNWTTFNYDKTFISPYNVSSLSTVEYGFTGKDNNYWAGNYGPEIQNVNFSLKYSVDPCVSDPLYSPTCPGYFTALNSLISVPEIPTAVTIQTTDTGTDFVFGDDISDFYDTEPQIEEEMFVAYEDISMDMLEEGEDSESTEEPVYEDTSMDTLEEEEDSESTEEPVYEDTSIDTLEEEEDYGSTEEPVYEDTSIDTLEEEEDYGSTEAPGFEDTSGYGELSEEFVNDGGDIYVEELAALPEESSVESEEGDLPDEFSIEPEEEMVDNVEVSDTGSFTSIDTAFEVATLEVLTMEVQQEAYVDVKMEASTPTQDSGFAAQQDQSFSTGQNISAVLNNVAPNYSKFDIAPPSQSEQRQTEKAEAAAEKMSEEELESSMDTMLDSMKENGGFGDQSLTMFLIGRNAGFAVYNTQLQDTSFYAVNGMPVSRVQNDRNTLLQLIGTDDKHQRLVDLQYGE